jgi:hypothetical protein
MITSVAAGGVNVAEVEKRRSKSGSTYDSGGCCTVGVKFVIHSRKELDVCWCIIRAERVHFHSVANP